MLENENGQIDEGEKVIPQGTEGDVLPESDETSIEEGEEQPSYEPSLIYKFKDDHRTFDEFLKPVITNKEVEDRIRDLYTRADGLDSYKEKLSKKEKEFEDVYNKHTQYETAFQTIKQYRDEGNIDKLASSLGISEDQLLQWSIKKAQELQLPEAERAQINRQRELESQLERERLERQRIESTYSQERARAEEYELQGYINNQTPLNQALLERGINLRDEVIKEGQYIAVTTKQYPTVKQVFDNVINRYKFLVQQQNNLDNGQQQFERKPTLPSVPKSNSSQIEEGFSLQKLRQMADQI